MVRPLAASSPSGLLCSIVIASYNRAELLTETLISLQAHLHAAAAMQTTQVVLVDNNSPDSTPAVMAQWRDAFTHCVCVSEPQQGLSYARNAGIAHALADVVVFLDDDVELADHWLAELLQPFARPEIAVVGGKVLAFGSGALPDWLPREYGYLVSVFDPFNTAQETDKVIGANFAVRTSALRSAGQFDPKLGRTGSKLLGGEEVDLFNRIRSAGGTVWYTPKALVFHKIANKLRKDYIVDYAYWLGVSEAHIEHRRGSTLRYALKCIRSWLFPLTIYPLARTLAKGEADEMRCTIKTRYAKGYLAMPKELSS
jgi:glucosyl-dolichyl phosphate glucuronosyltransferase